MCIILIFVKAVRHARETSEGWSEMMEGIKAPVDMREGIQAPVRTPETRRRYPKDAQSTLIYPVRVNLSLCILLRLHQHTQYS